jgi:hypothetical protein
MTEDATRKFKGVWMPSPIFLHHQLSPLEKILWADIDSFCVPGGTDFFKSNASIAAQYGVSERSVTRAIANLQGLGLIAVSYQGGRVRHLKTIYTEGYPWNYGEAESPNSPPRVDKLANVGRQIGEAGSSNWLHRVHKENTNEITNLEGVHLFTSDAFSEVWMRWLKYRDEAKLKTTPTSLKASLTKLVKLSNGVENVAIDIVEESIANGWKGFFPLKNQSNGKPKFTTDGVRDFIAAG